MGPAGNHEGRDRTQAKIQEKYYWPGVTKDVKNWVSLLYVMCKRYALINPVSGMNLSLCGHVRCSLRFFLLHRYNTVTTASEQNENLIILAHICILYQFQTMDGGRLA